MASALAACCRGAQQDEPVPQALWGNAQTREELLTLGELRLIDRRHWDRRYRVNRVFEVKQLPGRLRICIATRKRGDDKTGFDEPRDRRVIVDAVAHVALLRI